MNHSRGFTLIELIVVIVILGILSLMAVIKYIDLANKAKQAATQASLSSVRSTLYMKYAETASALNPSFPDALMASDFAMDQLPKNSLNGESGIGTVSAVPGGKATSPTDGFWYIKATGRAGAYSDGSIDTGGW